jgi:hypothetical protein
MGAVGFIYLCGKAFDVRWVAKFDMERALSKLSGTG